MFSRRTQWPRRTDPLAHQPPPRCDQAVSDLTVSNPTHVGLPLPWDAVAAALHDARAAVYEPAPFGLESARRAVAAYHQDRVPASQVVLSASTSEAYSWLFHVLCDPGDAVLVPVPSYPLFEVLAGLAGIDVVPVACPYADGWHLDLAAIAQAVTPRTRAIVAVSPNNPTGAVLTPGDLSALTDLCAEHSLALIVDEVFADWLRPGVQVHSAVANAGCLTFTLSGLSKVCLLPQLKLGWIAVSGPEVQVVEALARLEQVADAYLSVAGPVQHALPALLGLRHAIQAPLRERIERNRRVAHELCAGSPVSLLDADGGWALVLRVPADRSDDQWVEWLASEAWVRVQPGWFYDFAGDGWLVGSAIVDEDVVAQGVAGLVAAAARSTFTTA